MASVFSTNHKYRYCINPHNGLLAVHYCELPVLMGQLLYFVYSLFVLHVQCELFKICLCGLVDALSKRALHELGLSSYLALRQPQEHVIINHTTKSLAAINN